MGSQASTPVVVKEIHNQACNMHDFTTSSNNQNQLVMLVSVLIVVVVFIVCTLLVCLMRRHYHKKIHQYTHRVAREGELLAV
jgi:glucan phosphoethanolaminetransferase (alkaline phosphatase superfamily)